MLMNKAFTLVEVLIATLILSITLITLSSGGGTAMYSTRRAILFTEAGILASNMMNKIDLMIELEGFKYLEKIGKKREGSFEEKQYSNWKWSEEVKDVNIPVSELIKSLTSKKSEDINNTNGKTNVEEEVFINLIGNNIDQIMKKAIREVTVTVYWPIRAGKDFSSTSIVYYVVDYEEVSKFVPSI